MSHQISHILTFILPAQTALNGKNDAIGLVGNTVKVRLRLTYGPSAVFLMPALRLQTNPYYLGEKKLFIIMDLTTNHQMKVGDLSRVLRTI